MTSDAERCCGGASSQARFPERLVRTRLMAADPQQIPRRCQAVVQVVQHLDKNTTTVCVSKQLPRNCLSRACHAGRELPQGGAVCQHVESRKELNCLQFVDVGTEANGGENVSDTRNWTEVASLLDFEKVNRVLKHVGRQVKEPQDACA